MGLNLIGVGLVLYALARPSVPRGLVVSAVLGIGLGMRFAPERGDATRRRLRKRPARLRERAGGGLERAGKRTRKELARRRQRLEEALERVRER